jgi:ketosteroid isomerase-like protein
LLTNAYARFNRRDVDGLLAMMTDDVEWPDMINGVVLRDKDAIRSYWEGQFAVASPIVTPLEFFDVDDDVVVAIYQKVLDLQGNPLAPETIVYHRYTFKGDQVRRMVVSTKRPQAS